jgi:hypothetical protein
MPIEVTARSWPMRWPTGAPWLEPRSLDHLKGTPIDCLVVSWSAVRSAQGFRAFVEDAGRRGIAVVAIVESTADQAAAGTAGVVSVASSQALKGAIPWTTRAAMPRNSAAPVLAISDSVWPLVRISHPERWAGGSGSAAAEAGPTGIPWVDSNGWLIQMARVLAPRKGIWITADPPKQTMTLRAETYALAIADAAAYGGRWVVTLDEEFASGIAAGNDSALADWRIAARVMQFFSAHQEWTSYEPISVFGVISDFRGENEFLATETLNLISRRHLPFRILEKSALQADSLTGLKAVVYADQELPGPVLRKQLLAFVQAGGLLVCTKNSASLASGPSVPGIQGRFEMRSLGTGRIAASTEDQIDPFLFAADCHLLLGRREDLVRVWNPGASNSYYAAEPGLRNGVFGILSFTRRQVTDLSVHLARSWRSVRSRALLDADQPLTINPIKKEAGIEINVPPFSVFCALELEG